MFFTVLTYLQKMPKDSSDTSKYKAPNKGDSGLVLFMRTMTALSSALTSSKLLSMR
ncbi:hypothetical protein SHDE107825_00635 [Shewanella denitrificans]